MQAIWSVKRNMQESAGAWVREVRLVEALSGADWLAWAGVRHLGLTRLGYLGRCQTPGGEGRRLVTAVKRVSDTSACRHLKVPNTWACRHFKVSDTLQKGPSH